MDTYCTSSMASGLTSQHKPSRFQSGGMQSERHSKGGKDGPQTRSRPTLSCTECKRSKLLCDRKAPCSSCVRRERTERCIYSQEATEKVDLQSLHNRMMAIELAFLRVLNGLSANYVPTHPAVIEEATNEGVNIHVLSSTIAAPSSSPSNRDRDTPSYPMEPLQSAVDTHGPCSQSHSHHHHLVAPIPHHFGHSNPSAIELMQQTITILRQQLQLEGQSEPHSQLDATDAIYALDEMEPDTYASTQEDDIVMKSSSSSSMFPPPFISTSPSSSSPSTLKLFKAAPRATVGVPTRPRALPSPNIYFEEAFGSALGSSHGSGVLLPSSAAPLYWGCAPPPAHLARQAVPTPSLAPKSRRESQASLTAPPPSPASTSSGSKPAVTSALRRTLPSASRCSRFLKAAIEVLEVRPIELGLALRPNNGRSAWDAFEDRCRALYPANSHTAPGSAADESLPFFALVCALLAVGASRQGKAGDTVDTGAFLFALSQQALDVWFQSGQRNDSGISGELDEAIREERAEYIRACLVQVLYLLGSTEGPLTALKVAFVGGAKKDAILNNVKKMVSALTRWGLDKALASPAFDTVSSAEESWRRLYWEVLFYDLFISDALGAPRSAPTSFYKAPLPSLDSQPLDGATPDALPDGRLAIEAVKQSSRPRSERVYLTLRAQLTQLGHDVQLRIATPDCCYGYTADQAIGMWGEVQHWTKSIPVDFAYPFEFGSKPPVPGAATFGEERDSHSGTEVDTGNDRDSWLRKILGCELALATQSLLIQILVPFAPLPVGQSLEATDQVKKLAQNVLRELVGASQATIRLANFMKDLLKRGEPSIVRLENPPITLSFYALDDIVLDATIVCSWMCLQPHSNPAPSLIQSLALSGGGQARIELMQSVGLGLDVLDTLHEGRSPGERRAKNVDLVDALRTRWKEHNATLNTRPVPLKRKRDLSGREPLTSSWASPGETVHVETANSMDGTPSGYGSSNLGKNVGSSRQSPSSSSRSEHLLSSRSHTAAKRSSSNTSIIITPELVAATIASKTPRPTEPPTMRTIIANLGKSSKTSKSKARKPSDNSAVHMRVRPNKMWEPGAPVIPPVVYTSMPADLASYIKTVSAPKLKSSSRKKAPPVESSKRAAGYENGTRLKLNTDVSAAAPPPAPSSAGVSQPAYYHQQEADMAERSRSNWFSQTTQNGGIPSMASVYTGEPHTMTEAGPMNISFQAAHMEYPAFDDGSKYTRRHSIPAASGYGAMQTAEAAPMYGTPMSSHPYPYPQGFSYDRPLNSGNYQQDPPPDSGGSDQHSAGLTPHTSSPLFQIPGRNVEGPIPAHDPYYSIAAAAGPENAQLHETGVSYEPQPLMEMGHSQSHPPDPYQHAEFYCNVPSDMTGLETWPMEPPGAAHGNVTEQLSQPWDSGSHPHPTNWS